MKVSELEGAALDYWVAKAEGLPLADPPIADGFVRFNYQAEGLRIRDASHWSPSTNWAQGGPIIERKNICITRWRGEDGYQAYADAYNSNDGVEGANYEICLEGVGPTMLIAAMRSCVASVFGEEVPQLTT